MRKLVALVLALCFVCCMTGAAAEGTQEVKLGKMTLQIPADLVAQGSYTDEEQGIGMSLSAGEAYNLIITTMDMDVVQAGNQGLERLEDDNATATNWSVRLFGGLDGETAKLFLDRSRDMTLQEREWKVIETVGLIMLTYCSQGTGISIMIAPNGGTSLGQDELLIAYDIACSLQVEDAEEQ